MSRGDIVTKREVTIEVQGQYKSMSLCVKVVLNFDE